MSKPARPNTFGCSAAPAFFVCVALSNSGFAIAACWRFSPKIGATLQWHDEEPNYARAEFLLRHLRISRPDWQSHSRARKRWLRHEEPVHRRGLLRGRTRHRLLQRWQSYGALGQLGSILGQHLGTAVWLR